MRDYSNRDWPLPARVCHRAVEARDARFDGTFFVAIASTGIYCRPVCPSRPADPRNRHFFGSAAAAERHGFRPCFRCRPELAPGKALVDAVSRLASAATERIAAGALNAQPVGKLASDLHVSERHLRRALRREVGVTPVELAQTHRLLMAKRLLADTSLDMSRIAFASGFQSLRRFNAVFRERYGMPPTALRRASEPHGPDEGGAELAPGGEMLALTLAYRPPFAWDAALEFLARSATPGVEVVVGRRYGRTVRIGEHSGVVFAEDSPPRREVKIDVSGSLVPVLMPLLAGLRRLFDLDAEPTVIDAHLAEAGLGEQVAGRPGVRVPGALDGFETAMLTLLCGAPAVAGRVVRELGDPIDIGAEGLERITPGPARIAEAGENLLSTLGVSRDRARAIASVARAVVDGSLRLEPDDDVAETLRCLSDVHGVDDSVAVMIAMRALYWPDAFPADDATLMRAAGTATPEALMERAEAWRPWRAYAAMHLWRSKRSSPRNQTIRVPVRATTGRPLAM